MQNLMRLEIQKSRAKAVRVFFNFLLIGILGAFLIVMPIEYRNIPPLFMKLLGAANIGVAIYGGFMYAKHISDPRPGLTLGRDGITSHVGSDKTGTWHIAWRDISDIGLKKSGASLITFQLRDPQTTLMRFSPKNLEFVKGSYRFTGAPLHISTMTLQGKPRDLYDLCLDHWQRYRHL